MSSITNGWAPKHHWHEARGAPGARAPDIPLSVPRSQPAGAQALDRLPAIWDASDPGPALAQVLALKLQEIDARIAALQVLRQTLAERVATDCPLRARTAATPSALAAV